MSLLSTNIIDSISESVDYTNDSVFQEKSLIEDFNAIMENAVVYPSEAFKCTAECVRVQHMRDGNFVAEMSDVASYMESCGISSFAEAVTDICECNGIDSLALAVDEESLMTLKENAALGARKKIPKVCRGCGNSITECQCESYQEAVHPDVEMFNSITENMAECVRVGIPIVLKASNY